MEGTSALREREATDLATLDRTPPDTAGAARTSQAAKFGYIRHGTTTLIAAAEMTTGKVTEACTARYRHQEFLAPLGRSPRIRSGGCTW